MASFPATVNALLYVIYTSGSTGQPKGVMVGHRGVMNLLSCMRKVIDITCADHVLASTTLAFDIAALELYLPLICGARSILVERTASQDPGLLAKALDDHGITLAQATPAVWRMLLDPHWQGAKGLKVLCGGEGLPIDLAAGIRDQVEQLWNVYGPTETTIWSSMRQSEADSDSQVYEPIGRPISNTQIYLLDEHLEPVPRGVVGEIYIGGAGVARGYLNRASLTAERFMPDPYAQEAGARMYRSGDLGR